MASGVLVACAIGLMIGLSLGLLGGYYKFRDEKTDSWSPMASRGRRTVSGMEESGEADEKDVRSHLLNTINASKIRDNLRFLSSRPNLAGTESDREYARYIRDLWTHQGLSVSIHSYNVLLSFPDSERPNTVEIRDTDDHVVFTSSIPAENPELHQPYNAFSPNGLAQGELVYVNYARPYDFEYLKDHGVEVKGKVLLARYGWIFRGNKLAEAESRGAAGLILYSDPKDYNGRSFIYNLSSVYPESWWLPESGVQRGNVVLLKGDQLTQGYPATEHAYRLSDEALKRQLPQIPCQPVGYKDARELLSKLGGKLAPLSWQGGLDIEYRLGPGFLSAYNSSRVILQVNNRNRLAPVDNVVGHIKGSIEPDRYVILGSHRDAWGFGAVDPGSGQATLLEVVRAFSDLLYEGWRPRRTIIFCSWGGEESGLIGSTEWVEEFSKVLHGRIVSYHNLDSAVVGNYSLNGRASPSLRFVLKQATQQVPDPEISSQSVYDTWKRKDPDGDEPWIAVPGSGSDFAPFIQSLGAPVTDHAYLYNWGLGISSYPLYHTGYDVMKLMAYIDPDYHYCRAVGQIAAEMVRHLSDSVILPLDMEEYGHSLHRFLSWTWRQLGSKLEKNHISFSGLRSAVSNFSQAASMFHSHLHTLDINNPLEVRRYNDQLLLLERAFTDPAGLPHRPLYRHLVFSPSSRNHYSGAAFSGLFDLMYDPQDTDWEGIKQHLAAITYVIQSAALTLISDLPS